METEIKRELLRYKILHSRDEYDPITYLLLRYTTLNEFISKINEISLHYNIELDNDDGINASRFIELLDKFNREFRFLFFNTSAKEYTIRQLFRTNPELIEEHFELKYDNEQNIKESIYRIIISNFIKNAKYIPAIELFLKENKVELKKPKEYNYSECYKIAHLMSDLIFCLRGRGNSYSLFIDIGDTLDTNLTNRKKRRKDFDSDKFSIKFIKKHNKVYDSIFTSYEKKKKYLKYFK